MSRLLLLAFCACLAFAPPTCNAGPVVLTAKQATRELRILKRAFVDLHPGLTRYQSLAQLDAEFAHAEAEVLSGSDSLQMYLLASRLAASIRCGHTWTNPLNQGERVQAALASLPALPVRVRLMEDRLLVIASADSSVHKGDELLAIGGRTPAEIVADLLPYLRADGSNDGKRRAQLDSNVDGGALDRFLPLLHPPANGRYALNLQGADGKKRSVSAGAMSAVARERLLKEAGQPGESEDWRFEIDPAAKVATLTLPTFALFRSDFDWRGFLKHSFDALDTQHVTKLVIDLRQNEGGDDAIGNALESYLITTPQRIPAARAESAYERVPYDLARFLDTWDFGFFDRTDKVVRGPGRNWLLREQPDDTIIAPVAQPYRGRVAVLTGPRMSSSGYLIVRNLKAAGAAKLIGQRTGGALRGLNGGQLAWIVLPTSGVAVDIPLIASFAKTEQPDRGVLPDIAVRTRLEDIRAGRDPDRISALAWLQSGARR